MTREEVLNSSIVELINFVWDFVKKIRYNDEIDIDKALKVANQLSVLVEYCNNSECYLPETTVFLADAVVITLRDIIDTRSK